MTKMTTMTKIKGAALAACACAAIACAAPALAGPKLKQIYRFSGVAVGLPAGDLVDDGGFAGVDEADAERIVQLSCNNFGEAGAVLKVVFYDQNATPYVFDKYLEPDEAVAITTSQAPALPGPTVRVFRTGEIRAGLGIVLSNRTEIACSALVAAAAAGSLYQPRLERVN